MDTPTMNLMAASLEQIASRCIHEEDRVTLLSVADALRAGAQQVETVPREEVYNGLTTARFKGLLREMIPYATADAIIEWLFSRYIWA